MPVLDLTHADAEPLGFDETVKLAAETGGDDVVTTDDARLRGVVEKGSSGYLVEGQLSGGATLRCVRCLADFQIEVEERFELELLPLASAPSEEETQLGRRDLETRFYEEPRIALEELAAEQLELVLPMKPLCDEACRGLCPRCGTNLNEGQCSCPEETDARWAPLADWRETQ